MSTDQNFAWDQYDNDGEAAKKTAGGESAIPDGDHVFTVKGLRRYPTKAGDAMAALDLSVVASKEAGSISRKFLGVQIEVSYFLPKPGTNDKVRKMNMDRLIGDLTKITGKIPAGTFSGAFDTWAKEVIGLSFVGVQKTSAEKGKDGKPYINYYVDRAYTLTDDDDRAVLGPTDGKPGVVIPF